MGDAREFVVSALSQISVWASKQSRAMEGYFELEGEVAKAALRDAGTLRKIWRGNGWKRPEVMDDSSVRKN